MSLSVNQMSLSERQALAQCHLGNQIVAVELSGFNGPKIVTLSRDQVSCWQLFLRCFGCGNLATKKVHLSEVAAHLNHYAWAPMSTEDAQKDPAYRIVCQLANKAMLKGSTELFYNVSHAQVQKNVELMQMKEGRILNQLQVVQNVHWNPALQVQHVIKQLANQFPYSDIFMTSETGRLSRNYPVSQAMLKSARIIVQQRFPEPKPVPVLAPVSVRRRPVTPRIQHPPVMHPLHPVPPGMFQHPPVFQYSSIV
ncbi:MAG: hypothetical protein K2P51_02145 [Rhabdochlamydiaceae bacterium]|nr:hypothetical protein [Rhabdochlamydiaceae bacterium]